MEQQQQPPSMEQLIVAAQDLSTQQSGILLSIKSNWLQFVQKYVELDKENKRLKTENEGLKEKPQKKEK